MQKVHYLLFLCFIITISQAMKNPENPHTKQDTLDLTKRLMNMVPKGDIAHIAALIEQGADPNACLDGQNALHLAAKIGRTDVVQQLLKAGAHVDAPAFGFMNATALCLAVYYGHVDVAQELIDYHADLNVHLADIKATPLHLAAMKGRVQITQMLIAAGAKVNARNRDNCTPLHTVAECGKFEIIKFLRVSQIKSDGVPKKSEINQNAYVAIADLLIRADPKLLDVNPIKGTALHLAARYSQPELVSLLIQRGANLTMQRPINVTPLHEIVVGYASEILKQPQSHAENLLRAFLCTPTLEVLKRARTSVLTALCCFNRFKLSRDVRNLLRDYCLVPFLVDEQLKMLKKICGITMKFGPMDWTPSELATAQGNAKMPALIALADRIDPNNVEQHRALINDYLYTLLQNKYFPKKGS